MSVRSPLEHRQLIREALDVLRKSERGREIAFTLMCFLKGAYSRADSLNKDAVQDLVDAANHGFAGSVIDGLSEL